jgi:hypothetical protein
MNKFQIVALSWFAVIALGAMLASSASAETTLAAEWLVAGRAITAAEGALGTETSGEILLEDEGVPAGVLCSVILVGTVMSRGQDTILEVLNLKKEKIELGVLGLSIGKGDCVNTGDCPEPAEVWPEGLPWNSQLVLKENGEFVDLIIKAGGGTFGYTVLCTVMIDIEDTCVAAEGSVSIVNELEDTEATGVITPHANCTVGGAGKGKNEFDGLAPITLISDQLLTASE